MHGQGQEPTPEQVQRAAIDEYERTRPLTRVDWDRMIVIMVLGFFAIAFWVAFEQAGSSLNLFAAERTDRGVLGFTFPATWYQSVNPAAIVLLAPVFAWLWMWLAKRGWQPSTPVKFGIGLMLLSLGYVVMIFGALQADRQGLAGPQWLLFVYGLHTCGELCLSPVGLSMVTKLSPARCTSLMMGLYFGTWFLSNLAAGYVASFSEKVAAGKVFTLIGGQADFFLFLFVLPLVVGVVVLALSPAIKRMMHGLH
jgi:POT family proton-dependent oligopeptide transporter